MIQRFQSGNMIASGYVGSNNGIKTTQTGKQYATFSIAADRRDNETVWVTIKAWRNLALIVDALQKGDYVLATGRYEVSEYNGKTYKTLVADCIVPSPIPVSDAYEPPQESEAEVRARMGVGEEADELPF